MHVKKQEQQQQKDPHFFWGARFILQIKAWFKYGVAPIYWKVFLMGIAFSLFYAPFKLYERIRYGKKLQQQTIDKPPIFIIGHWRSGTTYLHSLLSLDPQMAYLSTLQALFPDLLLDSWIYKKLYEMIHGAIPTGSTRIQDNVQLGVDEPQEEEFPMGNISPYCYYYSAYFPKQTQEIYHHYLTFKNASARERKGWKKAYLSIIKKALLLMGKTQYLSKNPPNTGRIPLLLELFPNAKFIYIYRNPIKVFLSTKKLMRTLGEQLQLQHTNESEREERILWVYRNMVQQYLNDKHLIPTGNLVEVRFENLEENPLEILQNIYRDLSLVGYQTAQTAFASYIKQHKNYKKNTYSLPNAKLQKITSQWKFAMDRYGYGVPQDVDITDTDKE